MPAFSCALSLHPSALKGKLTQNLYKLYIYEVLCLEGQLQAMGMGLFALHNTKWGGGKKILILIINTEGSF